MAGAEAASIDDSAVFISGMASSSVGWRELPYTRVPACLDGASITQETFDLILDGTSRSLIHLISGLRSETDMMRGEETEIIGLFAGGRYTHIANDGVVVLPGTHSKHVRLHARQITEFHTFMTGELFEVLAAHSLLRASVETNEPVSAHPFSEPASQDAFVEGLHAASGRGLARVLFQTRTRTVLRDIHPTTNRWFLSGLLIGAEVADLLSGDSEIPILLAAPEPLSAPYRLAFETLGSAERLTIVPPGEMSLASVRGHLSLARRDEK